jgi:hypothetical protein
MHAYMHILLRMLYWHLVKSKLENASCISMYSLSINISNLNSIFYVRLRSQRTLSEIHC